MKPYNFAALDFPYASLKYAKIVILPVPYDATTTFRAGAREGPRAIIMASRELELFDEETHFEVYKEGIATVPELKPIVSSPEDMIKKVCEKASLFLKQNKFLVMLGGEHLLSLGMIKAFTKHFQSLSVLHLDAHPDLRENYDGSTFSNACVMYQALKYASIVSVGIRSLSYEEAEFIKKNRLPIFWACDIKKNPQIIKQIPKYLTNNVYITIDLDCLDPSIMPSVGTPEPGGLDWYEILNILKVVIKTKKVVGFDVVELCPQSNHVAADFLAARLVYKTLSYIFALKKSNF